MRIVALLTVRNEEIYIDRCLRHLIAQGIDVCVIDNESTDGTRDIAQSFLGRGVFRIETQANPGYFDLVAQLRTKERLAREIDADWFIHHDADEIREPISNYTTLHDCIEAIDRAGYNAINFEEFVFIPDSDGTGSPRYDYVERFRTYYFFRPRLFHHVKAWKKQGLDLDLVSSGGHDVQFPERRIYPENLILRHYIFLSEEHCIRKYSQERVYSEREVVERGWHGWRSTFESTRLRIPQASELKVLGKAGQWDRSDPKRHHLFIQDNDTA